MAAIRDGHYCYVGHGGAIAMRFAIQQTSDGAEAEKAALTMTDGAAFVPND